MIAVEVAIISPSTAKRHSIQPFLLTSKEITSPPPRKPVVATMGHYATTYVSSGLLLVGGLLVIRFASSYLGETEFSEFVLMRRCLSALIPVLSIGLAVSIAKQVPLLIVLGEEEKSQRLLASAYQISFIGSLLYFIAILVAPTTLSQLALGKANGEPLLMSSCLFAWGILWSICTVTYCRGQLWNHTASALQVVYMAICPLTAILYADRPESFFQYTGAALLVSNLIVYSLVIKAPLLSLRGFDSGCFRSLLQQGAPRVPGDAAYYGLLALPAVLATQTEGLSRGGEIAYALAMLTLLMQIAAPINQTALPDAAYLLKTGASLQLRRRCLRMTGLVFTATAMAVLFVESAAPFLVEIHLNETKPGFSVAIQQIVPAAISLNLFLCLRGIVDAACRRAVVPHLSIVALMTFFASFVLLKNSSIILDPVIVSFHIATITLAGLTFLTAIWVLSDNQNRESEDESEIFFREAA